MRSKKTMDEGKQLRPPRRVSSHIKLANADKAGKLPLQGGPSRRGSSRLVAATAGSLIKFKPNAQALEEQKKLDLLNRLKLQDEQEVATLHLLRRAEYAASQPRHSHEAITPSIQPTLSLTPAMSATVSASPAARLSAERGEERERSEGPSGGESPKEQIQIHSTPSTNRPERVPSSFAPRLVKRKPSGPKLSAPSANSPNPSSPSTPASPSPTANGAIAAMGTQYPQAVAGTGPTAQQEMQQPSRLHIRKQPTKHASEHFVFRSANGRIVQPYQRQVVKIFNVERQGSGDGITSKPSFN